MAAFHGQRNLVLGAWGCGAFGIDSQLIAVIFDDELSLSFRRVFETVVFPSPIPELVARAVHGCSSVTPSGG